MFNMDRVRQSFIDSDDKLKQMNWKHTRLFINILEAIEMTFVHRTFNVYALIEYT
jgi:hypothetical protein